MTLERCVEAELVGKTPSDLSAAALNEVPQVDNRRNQASPERGSAASRWVAKPRSPSGSELETSYARFKHQFPVSSLWQHVSITR